MEYSVSFIIGYLLGSIPAGYLLVKKATGIDISNSGTGNVGAMNSYEVTNSKVYGVVVLVLDLLKGLLSALVPLWLFPQEFTLSSIAVSAAVFSHCYNPWLQFKGGRGLATSAGGILVILPYLLLVWLILWAIVFYMKKDIHLGNVLASVLSLFLIYSTAVIAYKYTYPKAQSVSELVLFVTGLFLLILVKHIDPIVDLIKNSKFTSRKRR